MKLLLKSHVEQMRANYLARHDAGAADVKPVVKLFNPCGAATWLLSDVDENLDIAFGLCDLGMGSPELGCVSLAELGAFRGRFGLGIERDMHWKASKTLAEYAQEARAAGRLAA